MRFHVPIGVLKLSCESHVDSSSVQQTLANTNSFSDKLMTKRREAWREMPDTSGEDRLWELVCHQALVTLARKPNGSCKPGYQLKHILGSPAQVERVKSEHGLERRSRPTVLFVTMVSSSGQVLRTDATICSALAVAEIHSPERYLACPARSHNASQIVVVAMP